MMPIDWACLVVATIKAHGPCRGLSLPAGSLFVAEYKEK